MFGKYDEAGSPNEKEAGTSSMEEEAKVSFMMEEEIHIPASEIVQHGGAENKNAVEEIVNFIVLFSSVCVFF